MVAKAYITDGYTEKAFIKGIPGMYENVHFEYRTMLSDKIRAVTHSWALLSAAEQTRRINSVILKQVISWDIEHEGEVLPVEQKVLSRLRHNLMDRIFNIVAQFEAGDIETVESEELDLDKLLDETTTIDEQQEADSKN